MLEMCLGPVLGLWTADAACWQVSAIAVFRGHGEPPAIEFETQGNRATVDPEIIHETVYGRARRERHIVTRYVMDVALDARERAVTYKIFGDGKSYTFHVPAGGAIPNIAYASCNGFSNPRDMKRIPDKNALWGNLREIHERPPNGNDNVDRGPIHLLVMGGDQVYADPIWETVPIVFEWSEKSKKRRVRSRFGGRMRQEVEDFYFGLYLQRWSQPEPAHIFARVPSVMMWDDHDIFDGWGSYDADLQNCDVFQGIFGVARQHFSVFQMRRALNERGGDLLKGEAEFGFLYDFGGAAILALDMRSERSMVQVISPQSWSGIFSAIGALNGCKHLLVMSSIPVVHPDFSLMEKFFGIIPGRQELEDDLRDHWHSREHKIERLRLIHRLLDYSRLKETRVTILSGDVHVGAVGVIRSDRAGPTTGHSNTINQLTSSGIVHPPPPALLGYASEKLSEKDEVVDRGITASNLEFAGSRRRFIMARNWLHITPDDEARMWCNWYVEGEDAPYSKVIHAV